MCSTCLFWVWIESVALSICPAQSPRQPTGTSMRTRGTPVKPDKSVQPKNLSSSFSTPVKAGLVDGNLLLFMDFILLITNPSSVLFIFVLYFLIAFLYQSEHVNVKTESWTRWLFMLYPSYCTQWQPFWTTRLFTVRLGVKTLLAANSNLVFTISYLTFITVWLIM